MGATIMPASPGFYHNPETVDDLVDFMVARLLDHLGVEQSLMARWGQKRLDCNERSDRRSYGTHDGEPK